MAPRPRPIRPPPSYSEMFGTDGIGISSSGPSSSERVSDSQAYYPGHDIPYHEMPPPSGPTRHPDLSQILKDF
ncbi:unnamed protein product [Eruca vesicaria subsp. sativa]|uniref:Uncharacterized protein n=1 Tax=Eruca vesicaria subsp. sativa TaxID=29727 RepID=A0ABC8IZ56_ERUVS|nr:unnamed protein product [Eruca vesicaria subsp. sativa]